VDVDALDPLAVEHRDHLDGSMRGRMRGPDADDDGIVAIAALEARTHGVRQREFRNGRVHDR
jgi:hypothetical protein